MTERDLCNRVETFKGLGSITKRNGKPTSMERHDHKVIRNGSGLRQGKGKSLKPTRKRVGNDNGFIRLEIDRERHAFNQLVIKAGYTPYDRHGHNNPDDMRIALALGAYWCVDCSRVVTIGGNDHGGTCSTRY